MKRQIRMAPLCLLTLFGMGCQSLWDRPADRDPVMLGSDAAAVRCIVVYHPGASSFVTDTVDELGAELAARGFSVELMTAGPDKKIPRDSFNALILASPVYGAEIRPPVKEFVAHNAPFTVPVFVLLTGLFPGFYQEYDLPNLEKFLGEYGLTLTAATKLKVGSNATRVRQRTKEFADEIQNAIDHGMGQ